MSALDLWPKPLSREAFAPYGDVIEVNEGNDIRQINYGRTARHHDLARVDVGAEGGQPLLNIFRSSPISLPFKVEVVERHPLGSQAFIPLSGHPYLILVAPAGKLSLQGLQLFRATGSQGVNYHRGTWHHYCLALEDNSDFLVVDRGGPGNNCDESPLTGYGVRLHGSTREAS